MCHFALLPTLLVLSIMALSSRSPCHAQAEQDFSTGFELLLKSGLPDVRDYEWVRLDAWQDEATWTLQSLLEKRGDQGGSGWLAKEPSEDGFQRFVTPVRISTYAYMDLGKWQNVASQTFDLAERAGLSPAFGKLKPANEKEDIQAILEANASALKNFDSSNQSAISALAGNLFIAAYWHQRGFGQEANQLVKQTLSAHPEPERILHHAIGQLADRKLEQSIHQLMAKPDWNLLADNLQQLQTDFSGAWRKEPLVQRLLQFIAPRLQDPPAPLIQSAGTPLTPEQQAWWQKTTEISIPSPSPLNHKTQPPPSLAAYHWLEQQLQLPTSQTPTKEATPLDPFWQLNPDWDWIAILSAALDDTYPILYFPRSAKSHLLHRHYMEQADEDDELDDHQIDSLWQELLRPGSRGELALAMLKVMLPFPATQWTQGEVPLEEEIAQIKATTALWKKQYASQSPAQLARWFFEQGNHKQLPLATKALALHGERKDHELIESKILSDPNGMSEIAQVYVTEKRAEARPFLDQLKISYSKQMLEYQRISNQAKGNADLSPDQLFEQLPDYQKSWFHALETLTDDRSLADLIKDFLDAKIKHQTLSTFCNNEINTNPSRAQEIIETLLHAAQQTPSNNPQIFRLLSICEWCYLTYSRQQEVITLPDWMIAALKPLTGPQWADVTTTLFNGSRISVRERAAAVAALANLRSSFQMQPPAWMSLPNDLVSATLTQYGLALLNNEPLSELPSSDSITEQQKAAFKKSLKHNQGTEWISEIESRSPSEKLAILEIIQSEKLGKSKAWQPYLTQVQEVKQPDPTILPPETWTALQAQNVSGKLLSDWVQTLQKAAGHEPGSVRVLLNPDPLYLNYAAFILNAQTVDQASSEAAYSTALWLQEKRIEDTAAEINAIIHVSFREGRTQHGVTLIQRQGEWAEASEEEEWKGFREPPPANHNTTLEGLMEALDFTLKNFQLAPERPAVTIEFHSFINS